jgi:hypothetical protein
MHEKPTNTAVTVLIQFINVESSDVVHTTHHVTRLNTPIHNILSTTLQLSISQSVLGTLPEDGNVMPKRVGDTIHS